MVIINESVTCITEDDIQVGDVVGVDYSSSLYKVYAVSDDQVLTYDNGGSFWIDIAAVTTVEKQALKTKKEDGKKMEINVTLNESQIAELIHNVDVNDYEEFLTMDEWNDYMQDLQPTEIIDSTGGNYFNTSDEYAVMDGSGHWYSSSSLEEIFEPHLEEMLQDYIDSNL